MNRIKILVVEDDPIISMDIADQLSALDYEVIGQAYDAPSALEELSKKQPDLAMLDIDLGGDQDGVDIAHYINRHHGIPFIYLTSFADRTTLARVKETQPAGYIVKPFDQKDLLSQIEIALFNHAQRHPMVLLLDRINAKVYTPLTDREFELLKMIYEGHPNTKIAEQLYVSLNTVKTHIKNIYLKLDVNSRATCLAKVRELMQ
ncbi:MAG: response regulator transcription factor [Saprospiraceae bacterium]|nr:response regulator transcription factor [Lewinella sp.]